MAISPRRTPLLLACSLGAVAVIAAAGGSSGHSVTATASINGNRVTVIETEYHIAVPQTSYSPGSYTFTAVNAGRILHSLTITGPGVNATTKNLSPGASGSITVTLQAGSYDVFCPIDSHKSLGMNQEISVGATGGAGAAASTPTTAIPASPTTVPPTSPTTVPPTSPTTAPSGGGVSY